MHAAKPAALVHAQLLERSEDETPAVTMLTTTPNDALAHAELVHTYQPSRAVPRASACSTTLHVSLDGTHGDVASICPRDLAPLRQRAQSAGSRDGLQGQNGAWARVRSSSVVQARLPVTSYVNDHRPAHLIETTGQFSPLSQVQVELKKGQTIMADANLKQSSSVLHEDVSDRSGLPADIFELYHGGKRLEREATLSSRGVGKDSTIEVKMRGRGGAPQQGSFRLERDSLTLYWRPDDGKYLQVKVSNHLSIEDLHEKEGRPHSGDAPPSFLGPRRARWIRWSMLIVGCGILIFGVFLGGLLFALANSFSSEVAPSHVASNEVANRSTLEESESTDDKAICLVKHDVLLVSSLVRDEFMGTFFNASCIASNATGDTCDTSIAEEYVYRILAANRFSTLIVEFLAFLAMFAVAQVGGIPRPTNWSGMLCWLAWMVAQLAQYVVVLLMLVMEFFSFLSMRARLDPCLIRVDGAAMVDVVAHVSNLSLLTACPAI